jgi:hypothetical protein
MFSDSFFYLVDQIKDSSVLRCRAIVEWLPYVLLCAAHDEGVFERIRSRHTDAWFGYVGKMSFLRVL